MKKSALWVGVLLFTVGLSGTAGAVDFDHKHNFKNSDVRGAVKAFNMKMRLGHNDEHHRKMEDSVGWIFDNAASHDHYMKSSHEKNVLAHAFKRMHKLMNSGGHGMKHMAPVPEPEIYAMLIGGMALVAGAARRRRRSS